MCPDIRWATGARAIPQARCPLLHKALHPFAQGRIHKVERLGDGCDIVARHHRMDGLRTAKDAGLLDLFKYGLEGRQGMSGKMAFEKAHRVAP